MLTERIAPLFDQLIGLGWVGLNVKKLTNEYGRWICFCLVECSPSNGIEEEGREEGKEEDKENKRRSGGGMKKWERMVSVILVIG